MIGLEKLADVGTVDDPDPARAVGHGVLDDPQAERGRRGVRLAGLREQQVLEPVAFLRACRAIFN